MSGIGYVSSCRRETETDFAAQYTCGSLKYPPQDPVKYTPPHVRFGKPQSTCGAASMLKFSAEFRQTAAMRPTTINSQQPSSPLLVSTAAT